MKYKNTVVKILKSNDNIRRNRGQISTHNTDTGPFVFLASTHRLIFWCLTPLSAIFQLYHGDQF